MDRDPSAKDLIKRKLIGNGRVELAEILSKHWDTSLEEYAQSLWETRDHESNLEKEGASPGKEHLLEFLEEWERLQGN